MSGVTRENKIKNEYMRGTRSLGVSDLYIILKKCERIDLDGSELF